MIKSGNSVIKSYKNGKVFPFWNLGTNVEKREVVLLDKNNFFVYDLQDFFLSIVFSSHNLFMSS